ncbi:hypothetical protein G7Z17_g5025 [Cylindrodendrum hubeiense]|uniref:Polyketide synthase n=1 Tax=Cylindrodendrum hubeiense TaxID=595255 RepID=A0A9P5HCX2_9HYPO|nr:hypothetical protein G7Z17_g5025 [Cylindrodendrum hubeiense]
MEPSMTLDMNQKGVLSSSGSCKTFDAGADGYSRGEAINAILIKPLEDAIRDGDPIRAVIRSTAINSSGKTAHISYPSVDAQEALIRMAYKAAGIDDFSQTPFIECHGTGTRTGDPIEAAAIARVFGGHGVYMGSVKQNVGHGEGASGLTSIIKAVLSLENEIIPPNVNLSNPNPKIDFQGYKFQVPVKPTPWPKGRHARISISSFGIGGSNAHAILESAASFGAPRCVARKPIGQTAQQIQDVSEDENTADEAIKAIESWPRLLPVSASNEWSLERRVDDLRKYIEVHPESLNNIASTLGAHRIHLPYRTFCIIEDGIDATLNFSAQWAGMGETLAHTLPSFRRDIQEMDRALQGLAEPPDWTIEELLDPGSTKPRDDFGKAEIAQPLCTAIQLGIANFLRKCNILPSAVIGHSSGEIAAAYAAGVMTLSEAIICAYVRGQVTKQQKRKGSMAAIGMDRETVMQYLTNGVQIACDNGPKSMTISGDANAVEQTMNAIKVEHPDAFLRKLHVDMAYHSVFPCAGYIAMMGEAVRQILDSDAYMLRNLTVKSALILPETGSIEVMTTMRPSRSTDLTHSSWYDISISSLSGTVWVENCIAQGRASVAKVAHRQELCTSPSYPRRIPEKHFYERMQHMGLRYGPHFQGLTRISAHTKKDVAAAAMRNIERGDAAMYAVHPTAIDYCLQLCAVAGCRGVFRHMTSLTLPVYIRKVTVNPSGPDLVAEAVVDANGRFSNVMAVDKENHNVTINLERATGMALRTGHDAQSKEQLHAARLEWLPDVDLVAVDDLIQQNTNIRCLNDNWTNRRNMTAAIERVALVSLLEMVDVVQSLDDAPSGHLAKYATWLQEQKAIIARGGRDEMNPEIQQWVRMDCESRQALLSSLIQQVDNLQYANGSSFVRTIEMMAQRGNIEAIFTNKANPVELLLEDNRLGDYYNFLSECMNTSEFFRLCAHLKPTLRVLEVGAGTGGTTESVLKSLVSARGVRMYSRYTFTDISPGFLYTAKDRFKDWECVEYKTLDIGKDPAEQGFELGSYDLIVASNGFFPGWWVGNCDDRSKVPYVSAERWNQELLNSGFSGTDTVAVDDKHGYHLTAHMTSTAETPMPEDTAVTLLYKSMKPNLALELARVLQADGITTYWQEIGDKECHNECHGDIISVVDLEAPFFGNISQKDYEIFMEYLSAVKGGVLWLTGLAQIGCTNPAYGLVLGLARTIRVELSMDFWTVELDTFDTSTADTIASIARKFRRRSLTNHVMDKEYSLSDGIVYVGRYHWTSLHTELESRPQDDDPKQLVVGQAGLIDSLHWVQHQRTVLQADEVEIEDIMIAMGILQGLEECIGLEASGVITRVGSAVDHVKVGDRVLTTYFGLFFTRKVIPGHFVFPIPPGYTFEEAVTLPSVYMTAIHAIINLGGLKKGQIFATVGSEEKVQYLIDHHSIPRERIFNSRNDSFFDGIMQATSGRGVDLVLNSLSGDLLQTSWQCVAECETPTEILAAKAPEPFLLSSSSTYLMIGGLGGLGKAVTTWMVENGATSFVFLSRSAGTSDSDKEFLQELESQNCKVFAIAGSVANMADVKRGVDAAPTPIAGVLQMSMVLRDRSFFDMTYDDWSTAQDPKVQGTWNLHNALLGTNLDFFLLLSSLVGLAGHPGQANYSSANSFLDSFVQYRHNLGLPCSVIDIGCMEGIGILSEKAATKEKYTSMGVYMLQEQDLVEAIQVSINRSNPPVDTELSSGYRSLSNVSQLALGLKSTKSLSDPTNLVVFRADLRISLYNNMESADITTTGAKNDGLRTFLNEVEDDPDLLRSPERLEYISTEVGRTLFDFLMLPEDTLDIHMTLESINIDSLVAIELRNWFRKMLGLDVTILEIANAGTIEELGKLVIAALLKKYEAKMTQ